MKKLVILSGFLFLAAGCATNSDLKKLSDRVDVVDAKATQAQTTAQEAKDELDHAKDVIKQLESTMDRFFTKLMKK